MNKYKKGYTLLECVIAMSMIDIIMFLCATAFYTIYREYRVRMTDLRESVYTYEAFRIIENQIKDGNKGISFENHQIVIIPGELDGNEVNKNNSVNYILVQNGDLVIKYTTYGSVDTSNLILKGVKEFCVENRKNIIVISILSMEGRKYSRCIDIRLLQ